MKEWNHDRLQSVMAILHNVQNDMMLVTYRGNVSKNIQMRMAQFLRDAAEHIDQMECDRK